MKHGLLQYDCQENKPVSVFTLALVAALKYIN